MSPQAPLPETQVRRAVNTTYAQVMFNSVFVASTGGMFLIGYALRLGADNFRIGLLNTVPMCCVLAQLFGAWLVERRVSRKGLALAFSLSQVAGWGFILLLPYVGLSDTARIAALLAILAGVTLFAHVAANARASWVGDLIPVHFRGTFFGRLSLFGGIIGTGFALAEGLFLDWVKQMGLWAFSILFAIGMACGLVGALLFLPQPDLSLEKAGHGTPFTKRIREALENKALRAMALFAVVWSLQTIAGPFYATYMLRDLGMSFFGVGVINAAVILTLLASSPFWGRIVDRYGCRPVIVFCAFAFAPIQAVWIPLDTAVRVYAVVIPANLWVGFLLGGMNLALSTLIYKVTPSSGRSVQIAVYSVAVVLAAAPMPALGGKLPEFLSRFGWGSDLRYTFYLGGLFTLISAFLAVSLREEGAAGTGHLARNLFRHLLKPSTLPPAGPQVHAEAELPVEAPRA